MIWWDALKLQRICNMINTSKDRQKATEVLYFPENQNWNDTNQWPHMEKLKYIHRKNSLMLSLDSPVPPVKINTFLSACWTLSHHGCPWNSLRMPSENQALDRTESLGIHRKTFHNNDDALHRVQCHSFVFKQTLWSILLGECKANLPSSQVQHTQGTQSQQLPKIGLELASERLQRIYHLESMLQQTQVVCRHFWKWRKNSESNPKSITESKNILFFHCN